MNWRFARLSGLALALVSVLASSAEPVLATHKPDLQVQPIGGVQRVGAELEAVFRILNANPNVGTGQTSTAKVERLDKSGTPPRSYPVPRLRGNESWDISHGLDGPCQGYVQLRVTVDPSNTVDEAGQNAQGVNGETNNVWEGGLQCPPPPAAGSKVPGASGPAGGLTSVDVELGSDRLSGRCGFVLPAECTITLEPVHVLDLVERKTHGCNPFCLYFPPLTEAGEIPVGYVYYYRDELIGQNDKLMSTYQAAIGFDLGEIQKFPKKFVSRGELSYRERLIDSQDDDGNPLPGPRVCVTRLAAATVDWWTFGHPRDQPLPADDISVGADSVPGRQIVTQQIQSWLAFPADNHGFVLRGDGRGWPDINAECVSGVSDLELTVTFIVLE